MTQDTSPIIATALFFDDIRLEVGNKLSMLGNYAGVLSIPTAPSAGISVDRLAIFLYVRWDPDYHHPTNIAARILVPGQPPIQQTFPSPGVNPDPQTTPFKATIMQAVISLRFPPLRVGDAIEVWAEIDGVDYPAGRLRVEASAQAEVRAPHPV